MAYEPPSKALPDAEPDAERQRIERFGRLPERVHPDDAVAIVDIEAAQAQPADSEELRRALAAGG